MVSNHSLKQQAREISEQRKVPYTQALEFVKTRDAFDFRAKLSPQQLLVAKETAEVIRNGFNVLIYGGTGSGKSTMIHAVMEELSGIPRLLISGGYVSGGIEAGFKTEDPLYSKIMFNSEAPLERSDVKEYRVGAFDELRGYTGAEVLGYFRDSPALGTVHAMSAPHAISRARGFGEGYWPVVDWEFCYLLKCSVGMDTYSRTAHLYSSVAEEEQANVEAKDYSTELRSMSDSLVQVLSASESTTINEAIEQAAAFYGCDPTMMKYALSFAHTKHFVEIDYDNGTVIRLP